MNEASEILDGDAAKSMQERRETVLRFGAAWSAGDVETLLSLMSDEPVYKGSAGPGPGTAYNGRDQVRTAFQRMVGGNTPPAPNTPVPPPRMHFFGEHALVYWNLNLPGPDGTTSKVDGIDVLTFAPDGRIAIKDAYRKAFG